VVKKDGIDEDKELLQLQNFFLDIVRPLIAAFEKLSKEGPDTNLACVAM